MPTKTITCDCGQEFAPDESIGSELGLCQDCWEHECSREFWDAVTVKPNAASPQEK